MVAETENTARSGDSIFDPDGELAVDCSEFDLDMTELTLSRLLYQFQNSATLIQLNNVLSAMEQTSYDAAIDTIKNRTLALAIGANLDVLGDIVGQPRILLNADDKEYFGPDSVSARVSPPDANIGGAFVTGAPLFGNLPADDVSYRRLILAKIFKNHVKVGSAGEILEFIRLLTGKAASARTVDRMDIELYLNTSISPGEVRTIVRVFDDKTADRKYLTPLPTSARLVSILYKPTNAFSPDRVCGRPDFAELSMRVPAATIESAL